MSRASSRTLIASALIALAFALLILNAAGYLQPAESLAARPLTVIQSWLSTRYVAVRDFVTSPSDVTTLRQRNAELEAEVSQLQRQVIALQEQQAEAAQLAALLKYARQQPENSYLASKVIGRDVSPFLRSVWIDSGSDQGLSRGMPVATDRGLVGRVIEVRASIARVQLITDPEAAVNVFFQQSRSTNGVLAAQLNGELWVDLIDQNAVIDQGELVLTSGLGGGYPADIPVGSVLSVRKRDYDLFQQAVIQPSVDFDNLDIVLVITNFTPVGVSNGGP
jgi:rod shape-determining protein MreC